MMTRTTLAAALALIASIAGASPPEEAEVASRITGSILYREAVALPPDATVHVRLVDTTDPEMPPRLVAEATIPAQGRQAPIPFEIVYKAADIAPAHRYAIRATIVSGSETLFASKARYPVITHGAPVKVDVLVEPPASRAPRPKPTATAAPPERTPQESH